MLLLQIDLHSDFGPEDCYIWYFLKDIAWSTKYTKETEKFPLNIIYISL